MHVTYGILLIVALLICCSPLAEAAPADIPSDSTVAVAKDNMQVSIFGDVRFRGTVSKNPFDTKPSMPAYVTGGQPVESRMRIGLDFSANPSTSGRVVVGGSHEPR